MPDLSPSALLSQYLNGRPSSLDSVPPMNNNAPSKIIVMQGRLEAATEVVTEIECKQDASFVHGSCDPTGW